jgi:hypothetical protein
MTPAERAPVTDHLGPAPWVNRPSSSLRHQEIFAVNDKPSNKRVRPRVKIEVPPPEAVADRDGPDGADEGLPAIDRIPVQEIRVGAGGPLVVPREALGADIDGASELDLTGMLAQKFRKSARRFRGGLRFSAPRPGGTTETTRISGYP